MSKKSSSPAVIEDGSALSDIIAAIEEQLELLRGISPGEVTTPSGPVLPESHEEILELEQEVVDALFTKYALEGDGMKPGAQRQALCVVADAIAGTVDGEDPATLVFCRAAGLGVKGKKSKAIATEVMGYVTEIEAQAGGEATEEATAEEATAEEATASGEEATEEATASGEEATTSDDGVNRAEVAAEFKKFPDDANMKKRLLAHNKHADEEIPIGKDLKKAYRALVAKMIDGEGTVVPWGQAYIDNGDVCACGLSLEEIKTKKGAPLQGKCRVTEKIWEMAEDQTLSEVE